MLGAHVKSETSLRYPNGDVGKADVESGSWERGHGSGYKFGSDTIWVLFKATGLDKNNELMNKEVGPRIDPQGLQSLESGKKGESQQRRRVGREPGENGSPEAKRTVPKEGDGKVLVSLS